MNRLFVSSALTSLDPSEALSILVTESINARARARR